MDEEELIAANAELLVDGDDTKVECREHGVTARWGDLSPIAQLAVLAGLDVIGEECMLLK